MEAIKTHSISLALLLSSLIIGASFIYSATKNKYEFSSSPLGVYRLDKLSGKIDYCQTKPTDNSSHWVVDCSGAYNP